MSKICGAFVEKIPRFEEQICIPRLKDTNPYQCGVHLKKEESYPTYTQFKLSEDKVKICTIYC